MLPMLLLLGGLGFGAAGLFTNLLSLGLVRRFATPGGQPGTLSPEGPPLIDTGQPLPQFLQSSTFGPQLAEQINTLATLSPIGAGIAAQLEEAERTRSNLQQLGDRAIALFEDPDNPLRRSAGRLRELGRDLTDEAGTASRRAKRRLDEAGQTLSTAEKNAASVLEDPTVITPEEMKRIVDAVSGSEVAAIKAQTAAAKESAAARGASPTAIESLSQRAITESLAARTRAAADAVIQNEILSLQRETAARAAMENIAQLQGALAGIETDVGRLMSGAFATRGQFEGAAAELESRNLDNLMAAIQFRASSEIPLPLMDVSAALAATNLQNLGLTTDALGGLANSLYTMSGNLLNSFTTIHAANIQAEATREAARATRTGQIVSGTIQAAGDVVGAGLKPPV